MKKIIYLILFLLFPFLSLTKDIIGSWKFESIRYEIDTLDVDIKEIPLRKLRQKLGVVLQDTFLFSGNVADNLRLDSAVDDQHLGEICRELGLENFLNRLPETLTFPF